MLKLTKTGIGLLTKQYRSVLKKCLIANLCILYPLTSDAQYAVLNGGNTFTGIQNIVGTSGTTMLFWSYMNEFGVINLYHGDILALQVDAASYVYSIFDDNGNLMSQLGRENFRLNGSSHATGIDFAANVTAGTTKASHLATTGAVNQLLNYYYTFRVDESAEVIEFAEELETSFPVILRSAEHDVRISAQSAARIDTGLKSGDRHVALLLTMTNQGVNVSEAPLTFSAKTRDDSLFLGFMEVCHA